MIKRKDHTLFYFNEEFDQALRECDEARAAERKLIPAKVKVSEFGCKNCLWSCVECKSGSLYKENAKGECSGYTYYD